MTSAGNLVQQLHIPARTGKAVQVKEGQRIKVIDVQGKQVCDFFALNPTNPAEFLSGIYTRSSIAHMWPQLGKPLYNNQRQQILVLEEDTTPGRHDMLYAP
jgi:uncharacterized protein YcgI (DUF1989 family)